MKTKIFLDQEDQNSASKTKVDTFLDLKENQDDAMSNESNEQDEGINNSPDEFINIINQDLDEAIINEEFELVKFSLPEMINRDYPEEYILDSNVNKCITKDVSYKSFGLRAYKEPYMIIFTITKNFTLTWEVYLENYEEKFTEYIKDLLRVTHHIYFIGVTEENNEKFEDFWIDLSCNFYNNENKINTESEFYKINHNINLRSMIFIPHRPRATISHVFTKETLKIIVL